MNDYLIEKRMVQCCAVCGKSHEIEIRKRDSQALIKGESVDFKEIYYLCRDGGYTDDEFVPAGIMDENLSRARDAYRKKYNLLTSSEIVEIRKESGFSQEEFAAALSMDKEVVNGFETKAIQSREEDKMMRELKNEI